MVDPALMEGDMFPSCFSAHAHPLLSETLSSVWELGEYQSDLSWAALENIISVSAARKTQDLSGKELRMKARMLQWLPHPNCAVQLRDLCLKNGFELEMVQRRAEG